MLEEAGIVVTTVADGLAAVAATERGRFDLAIIPAFDRGGPAVEAALRARQPRLELLVLDRANAPTLPGFEPRRFIGRVRERLLCGDRAPADPGEEGRAEAYIAAAKVACLHQRRMAARNIGARRLAAELGREMAATVPQLRMTLWDAAADRHAAPATPILG